MTGTSLSATAAEVKTMSAAVLKSPGVFELQEVRVPEPGPREVRIRLEGCGVCASNVTPWEGKPWFTYPMLPGALGHEGWGIVDKVGPGVTDLSTGDRVAGLSDHAYAEYDVTEASKLIRLPAGLYGQPFPAEPLGCAFNILLRSAITSGQTVAIVGTGFLGTILTRLVSEAGARVIAVSRREYALQIAEQMGAWKTLGMDENWNVIEAVQALTEGRLCDVVIEAAGKQAALDLASQLVRERGRLVIAGYHQDGPRQVNMQLWNWRGLDVINAHERDIAVYVQGMLDAASAVESGLLDPSPLYTHTLALGEVGLALEMTRDRPDGFMKALILMPTDARRP